MSNHQIDVLCANGHTVTIRYERNGAVGVIPPARLYRTPTDASGAVEEWGIEQACGECGFLVRHSVFDLP